MSLRECRICSGKTANGAPCRRRTCKTFKYCWQHLLKETGLFVKPSKVPGAGDGLFTSKPIKKNTNIAKYEGERISKTELDRRYGDATAPYVLEYPRGVFIDARSTQSSIARYANACDYPGNRRACNAKLSGVNGYLRSTKNIASGAEILTPYGSEYWLDVNVEKTTRKRRRKK